MERRLELKAARVRKGWTQLHLALVMGVSQQTVAKWERGHNAPATFAKLRQLESALGVPMKKLFPDIFDVRGDAVAGECFNSPGGFGTSEDKPMVGL